MCDLKNNAIDLNFELFFLPTHVHNIISIQMKRLKDVKLYK